MSGGLRRCRWRCLWWRRFGRGRRRGPRREAARTQAFRGGDAAAAGGGGVTGVTSTGYPASERARRRHASVPPASALGRTTAVQPGTRHRGATPPNRPPRPPRPRAPEFKDSEGLRKKNGEYDPIQQKRERKKKKLQSKTTSSSSRHRTRAG